MKYTEIENLADLLVYISKKKNRDSYLNYLKSGIWQNISSSEFCRKTFSLVLAFKEKGIKQGDRVAIFADSSPYWLMFDFALQYIGAVSVPMFTNIAPVNLDFQIKDSKVKFAFVDGGEKWQSLKQYKEDFHKIFIHNLRVKGENIENLSEIFNKYESKSIPAPANIKAEDIATIIYTSGSTGNPKGVCLSHANLISQLKGAAKSFPLDSNKDVALSFLPLAHIFERLVILLYLSKKIKIYFADEIENVPVLLKEVKPTIMTTVPRFLEKVSAKINENIESLSIVPRLLAKLAVKYAYNMPVSYAKKMPIYSFFSKLFYRKFLLAFGGNIGIIMSGGAPLNPRLYKFLVNIDLPIYQGYGLTESSPVIAANNPKESKIGSSGKAFPEVKIKISEDGEILAKGPNVMLGYLNNKEETDKTIQDGWLCTGDLGYLDKDKFLYVTGRKKDLQKTSNGKYVTPTMLEARLKEIPYVDNAMIVADGRTFVSAIIFPDLKKLKSKKIKLKSYNKILSEQIENLNKDLNHWEQIRRFIISKNMPSIANEELTPSMKLRRHVITEHYSKEIEALYLKANINS